MTDRDRKLCLVRRDRNVRLSACDWTQLADAPISAAKAAEWRAYRQRLRDLPATADAAGNVAWPSRPA